MRIMRWAAFPALLLAAVAASGCTTTAAEGANGSARETASAQQDAEAFLESFNSMDAARFDEFFADDVTIFFPAGPFPRTRVNGKAAVTAAFHQLFELARARGTTRLGITPLDLQVQDYGSFAVVSFQLRGNGNVGRRSIILRRQGANWKIVHFHASALQEPS